MLGAAARRDEAKAQLEQRTIRAPIAGEILSLKFRAGEYYTTNGDPLAIMGDTRIVRVRMDVDERDVARIALGAKAFATSTAFPGRRFNGKVVEIGKRMGRKNVRTDDPVERIDTKILEVVFQLDDRDGLVPGLRVTGHIESTRQ
jgi:multidrug resistance efflux pump